MLISFKLIIHSIQYKINQSCTSNQYSLIISCLDAKVYNVFMKSLHEEFARLYFFETSLMTEFPISISCQLTLIISNSEFKSTIDIFH
jgi:hypothetical protein